MKRKVLALPALLAGMLLIGLVPGSTLATNSTSNLDQSAATGAISTGGSLMAQTFTAGRSGLMTGLDLSLAINGTTTVSVSLQGVHNVAGDMVPDGVQKAHGSRSVTGASSSTPIWPHFSFTSEPTVVAGTMYAIVFDPGTAGVLGGADVYSGGSAWARPQQGWIPFFSLSDFGFRTYVDNVGTVLQWDKPQITGGTTTPLILTETMTYANGVEAGRYMALLTSWPTWFTPTGLTCSDTASKIVQTDCKLANLEDPFAGLSVLASASGDIMTFTVTGTAAPASSANGTSVDAGGNACINYPDEMTFCGDGLASVDVIAATTPAPVTPAPVTPAPVTPAPVTPAPVTPAPVTPAPTATPSEAVQGETSVPTRAATPPPTSTGSGSSSNDSGAMMWFLPFGLIAFLGALVLAFTRTRRPIA